MFTLLRKMRRDDRGISALEYALLAGTILVVIGGALTATGFKTSLTSIFSSVQSDLTTAAKN